MADYRLDHEAFGRLVLNAPWMVQEMHARVEQMKAYAESISPYDPNDSDGQHYRDAFETEAHSHGGVHKDRAVGILRNTDDSAVFVEFGARNTPEHAVLRKSLDAVEHGRGRTTEQILKAAGL